MKMTIAVLLAAALAASVFLKVHYIRDDSGAELFWRADEAYLFVGTGHTGYCVSYLVYPWVVLKEYLHAPPSPADQLVSTTVIRMTPSAVERHVVAYGERTSNAPLFLTPFDDGFYAMCPGAILCKWTGSGFDSATEEEQRRLDGTNRLIRGDMNNIINGWHVHYAGRSPGDHFEVEVGKNSMIAVKNQATDVRAYPWISVDLLRPGQPPESLYDVNGTPRRVSKAEYERVFPKPN
jgi:hypothetical protein